MLITHAGRLALRGVGPGGAPDFLHGHLPRTLDEEDLRSMRAAGAVELDQLGLGVAPGGERRAPFARAIDRVDRWQQPMTAQYTIPVATGPSRPVLAGRIASSSSASPASRCPSAIRAWPSIARDRLVRFGSPKRSPISAARRAASHAPAASFWDNAPSPWGSNR